MDTTPLPNQDSDVSDSDQESQYSCDSSELVHYVVRITSHGKFSSEDLIKHISEESEICAYVVSRETVPQEHYHLVLSIDENLEEQVIRDIIKAFLVPLWQGPNFKLPRGFGNKQYSLELSTDKDKAISYALKQQIQYWYEGYTEEYILSRIGESFDKKKPSNFKVEYREYCKKFRESTLGVRDFMISYVQLKAKYEQLVNVQHAHGYAISNVVGRDPSEAEKYVDNYLYNK